MSLMSIRRRKRGWFRVSPNINTYLLKGFDKMDNWRTCLIHIHTYIHTYIPTLVEPFIRTNCPSVPIPLGKKILNHVYRIHILLFLGLLLDTPFLYLGISERWGWEKGRVETYGRPAYSTHTYLLSTYIIPPPLLFSPLSVFATGSVRLSV